MNIFRRPSDDRSLSDTSPMTAIMPFQDRFGLAHTAVQMACESRDWRLRGGRTELADICAEAARRWQRAGDERDFEYMLAALYKSTKFEESRRLAD